MDSYQIIKTYIDRNLKGIDHLCDIGSGGVFNYSTGALAQITALDLFLDKKKKPSEGNILFIQGSALEIPFPDQTFDGVLLSMVLHHLTGESAAECQNNLKVALKEAHRVLKSGGGTCVVVESCLPPLIYGLESIMYPVTTCLIDAMLSHPATFLYSAGKIQNEMERLFGNCKMEKIPRGYWQLFLGFKVPTMLVPSFPHIFVSSKI